MNRRLFLIGTLLAAVVFVQSAGWAADPPTVRKTPRRTPQAWTFPEAMQQLRLYPNDVYLQYVVLQLGRSENKLDQAAGMVRNLNRRRFRRRGPERRVDLFALFSGALAVQESLQLDTMAGPETWTAPAAAVEPPPQPGAAEAEPDDSVALAADPARNVVNIAELAGPTVKSHPWGKMLAAQRIAGKTPKVSPLALCVPDDQYYVVFRSLGKLLEAVDVGDLWGDHLMSQADKSAKTQRSSERLKMQLAMKTDPLTRPFYDMVVEEVAITGSDLFFREGSDVTMLFRIKQPEVFRLRMDGFLAAALAFRPDAVKSTGKVQGVDYTAVTTADRAIHVYSAYPKPNLHVRTNSKVALKRVLAVIAGADGVKPLGEATEFKYIRTLMARGDKREDGFVYLSDPFIRRMVSAELKLTERRRMLCYNHLRMIGHAAMLYRTQFGAKPKSLQQLTEAGCAPVPFATDTPARFGKDALYCPCGGKYRLSADGAAGVCSHHGRAGRLVPCCEIALQRVTEPEAKAYKQFVQSYSRYWQRYFDPIAVRIQLTPKQYRAETIVLPLIDNSIYTSLAMALGGEPEPLDALPVPKRNIFSMAVRLNKEVLLKEIRPFREMMREFDRRKIQPQAGGLMVEEFLTRGIGNQIGMHVYDASPMFDFNLPEFLGEVMGSFRGGRGGFDDEVIPISFLVSSLNAPVYVAIPVKDAKIVDKFLDQLDTMLAELARRGERGGWFNLEYDFYRVPLERNDHGIRCYCVGIGPVKWRLFFARIGDGLYIASKRFILEDLAAAVKEKRTDGGPVAHAMVRVRPENWKQVLPSFRLGWAEGSRRACLGNLGPLSSVARALGASGSGRVKPAEVHTQADKLHAVHFFCPDGGQYQVSADGKQVSCSVHGTAAAPRQPTAPAAGSAMGKLLKDFSGLTAALTFLEDGLHAVVTIDRK